MKYLKYFENNEEDPKLGDYVICKEHHNKTSYNSMINIVLDFTSTAIGKVVLIEDDNDYIIKYDKLPEIPEGYIIDNLLDTDRQEMKYYFDSVTYSTEYKNCRRMFRDEIKFFSPNKEDLMVLMNASKYNL